MQAAAPPVPTPKRSRRRWYIVGGFVFLSLATPFLYLLIVGHWRERELEQIYREMDAEDPNWRWADLVKELPPPPPDERNAIVQAKKVIGILKATPFASPFNKGLPKPVNARLKDADEQRLRAALGALAPMTLEEAYKLKDMPEGGIKIPPATGPLDSGWNATEMLKLTRMLKHDAMLSAHQGKMEEAADACLAIVHSAHAIGDFPSVMPQVVRSASQQDAVEVAERTLALGSINDNRLEGIQAALSIEAKHNGVLHALRGERAFGHYLYLAIRDGNDEGKRLVDELKLQSGMRGRLYYLFPGILLRRYPERLRLENAIIRANQLDGEARAEALRKLEPMKAEVLNGTIFGLGNFSQVRIANVRVRCAVAAIAAERFRLKYDHWPTSIAELTKEGLLKEPMTDPVDGQPLRVHRTETGLIVYSIGEEKIDNQGKKGNIAFELWLPKFRAMAPAAELEALAK